MLVRWVLTAAALYATVRILGAIGLATVLPAPWYAWFLAVAVMGLVNSLIRPVAQMLTAPLNCLTFGLVGVLINGLMFWLVPTLLSELGLKVFTVQPLGAVLGAILIGMLGGLLERIFVPDKEDERGGGRRDRDDP